MIRIEIRDAPVQALLTRLAASVNDLSPAMREIGGILKANIGLGFGEAKSPWGEPWKPLRPNTIIGRLKNNKANFSKRTGKLSPAGVREVLGGFVPLSDTGRLGSSFSYLATGNSVTVGTDVPYAGTHQFGAKLKNIPSRPFMPIRAGQGELPARWQQEIVGILQRRLRQATGE